MGKQVMDKEIGKIDDNIEGGAGAVEFLKCSAAAVKEPAESPIYVEALGATDDAGDNGHSVLKRTSGLLWRIFANQGEDGTWLLRWDVPRQAENDFVALCYQGKNNYKKKN